MVIIIHVVPKNGSQLIFDPCSLDRDLSVPGGPFIIHHAVTYRRKQREQINLDRPLLKMIQHDKINRFARRTYFIPLAVHKSIPTMVVGIPFLVMEQFDENLLAAFFNSIYILESL